MNEHKGVFFFLLFVLSRDFLLARLMAVLTLSVHSQEFCSILCCFGKFCCYPERAIIREVGIKSIIHCLDNFLFIEGCDSETCQHISASFQELAAKLGALLAEDLAFVLTFMLWSWIF